MILSLILIPFIGALSAFVLRKDSLRKAVLVFSAFAHFILCLGSWRIAFAPIFGGVFSIDNLGRLFLSVTSILFLICSVYVVVYLKAEREGIKKDIEERFLFRNMNQNIFIGCLLLFLTSMTLVTLSRHFGILWVSMEATTLFSAPLIFFHRHHRSLEAVWKYLIICSVGIALALIGNIFLSAAFSTSGGNSVDLLIIELTNKNIFVNTFWLKGAFIFLLIGYGTKMGLAPMHSWLPDAHSEAPSAVSALLSGALLNCAFLSILRIYQVCGVHGLGEFCRELFIMFGVLSIAFSVVFIIGQKDYKRMLAYSSIENMGILILGIGLGGSAVFGSLLHAVNHSFAKAMLFLVSGNILRVYKTKLVYEVKGVFKTLRLSGFLWFAGFLVISGMPPFGIFISKFIILKSAFNQGHYILGTLFLIMLAMVFISMAVIFINMSIGDSNIDIDDKTVKPSLGLFIPPLMFFILVLFLGLYIPQFLTNFLTSAASVIGGGL
ncbi:MAG: proton-conducting transporter membrane subunit [Elusimicrobiota bacterium]